MILRQIEYLERETKKAISKAQQERNSGAITDEQYEYKYESIMDNFRLTTLSILSHRPTDEKQDWFGN